MAPADPKTVDSGTGTEIRHHQSNRLINEKSPYLLQHADNPVDWYPWGSEAFAIAKRLDKPIFLSIGYSTCHWCHVMEQESFENPAVAELLNEAFVCINVDREERPDIDGVYMAACQALTGSGGWPLTIIMTPDKNPFFAATYIPRESRFGRTGLVDLIPRVTAAWNNNRKALLRSASEIAEHLQRVDETVPGENLTSSVLTEAYTTLHTTFDGEYGGFGTGMKFPTAHNLMFLLRYWKFSGEDAALKMVEESLQGMRRGGIYDHVGFGIHRYSTDRRWLVPHFEKMLYDQALFIMASTETFLATGNPEYSRMAEETIEYVLRDMTSPNGAFYSAEDADSDGVEGKFYVWAEEELRASLPHDDANLFVDLFGVRKNGNYAEEASRERTGANILHLPRDIESVATRHGLTGSELADFFARTRATLFRVREKRIHPFKDDKVLTDWNGLMIAALAKAARALDQDMYARAASRAALFVLRDLVTEDGRLLHRFRDGHAGLQSNIDDYAFLVWGLIELYQASFDPDILEAAIELTEVQLKEFVDRESGAMFFTPSTGERLPVRRKDFYDGATPSGNSVTLNNLLALAHLTGNMEYAAAASRIVEAVSARVVRSPTSYTHLLMGIGFILGTPREIVIAGDPTGDETRGLLSAVNRTFLPHSVVVLRPDDTPNSAITGLVRYIAANTRIDGRAAAYVCRNYTCAVPVTRREDLEDLLSDKL